MKNKLNKKIAIVIAILAILIIGIGIFLATNKNDNVVSNSGTETELPDSVYYVPEGQEMTEDHLQEIIDYMNSYDDVLIHYTIWEDIYDKEDLYEDRNYLTEYASIIEVKEKKDRTLNTHLLYDEDGNFDDTDEGYQKAKISFVEAFGFDYKQCENIYELIRIFAKQQFADPDKFIGAKENGDLSEYIKENYGQSYYYYKNDNKDLIASIGNYDEIVMISSNLTTFDGVDETVSSITTRIKYKKDEKYYDRFYVVDIQLYDVDAEIAEYGEIEY